MIESTELLQYLCVSWVLLKHSFVRFFRCDELRDRICKLANHSKSADKQSTHILLLFVDVTNLEPDVDFGERSRRIVEDVSEAL
jgi:hypothetical protein